MGRRKKRKYLINFILISIFVIAFLAFFYLYKIPSVEILENPNQELNTTEPLKIKNAPTISEETENWYIDAVYPETGRDSIDTEVKNFIDNQLVNFKQIFIESGAPTSPENKHMLSINYSSQIYNNHILSFKFAIVFYTGGAHPNHNIVSLVFELKDNKKLFLSDLFVVNSNYLERISSLTMAELNKRESTTEAWVQSGAGPKAENYEAFGVLDDSLIFYFAPYMVASYSAGEQQVKIPFSQIKNILNPKLFNVSESNNTTVQQEREDFLLDSLNVGDKIVSPLNITGSINGNGWVGYEGQAGRVDLLDSSGNLMASSSLSATTNWMDLPVKFSATLTFIVPQGTKGGTLIFYNRNVSGKVENDRQVSLPVIFSQ